MCNQAKNISENLFSSERRGVHRGEGLMTYGQTEILAEPKG